MKKEKKVKHVEDKMSHLESQIDILKSSNSNYESTLVQLGGKV